MSVERSWKEEPGPNVLRFSPWGLHDEVGDVEVYG